MTLTQELAKITLAPTYDHLSDEAIEAAKLLLLDALGCAIAGWHADGCTDVVAQMRDWGGKPESNILFHGDKLPAAHAAFANSMMIHAQDFDDVHIPGILHISSIVVPAMLAIGQSHQATGRDALIAMTMGVEVAARIAIPEKQYRRGECFLPTSLAGSFGGVATAARLMKLTKDQCTHALGINYAQASGNRQA